HSIKIWDLDGERWVGDMPHGAAIGPAQDPGGRYLVVSPLSGGGTVYDAKTGRMIRPVEAFGQVRGRMAVPPDGRWLASSGFDQTITLWETSGWTRLRTLRGHETNFTQVAFHPDGRWLAAGGNDGTVTLWEPATGRIIRKLKGSIGAVAGLAFS